MNTSNNNGRKRQDLGQITNAEVIQRLAPVAGRKVIDIGCGSLTFTRQLVDLGAEVIAVDPDPVQSERNRADPLVQSGDIKFHEAGADHLPVEDKSLDGVFFSYSLHHIPAKIYPAVFAEVARVIHSDGFLYVIEPIDCPLNQVMRLFHNEDVERAAAQEALTNLAIPMFSTNTEVTYHGFSQYESFEQFADRFGNRSFNTNYSEQDVRNSKVRAAFEQLGGEDHRFQSPKMAMYLQGLV